MQHLQPVTVILLLIFVQIHQSLTMNCGRLLSNHNPLGDDTEPLRHWPWLAAIFDRGDKSFSVFLCGGTVITAKSVLTAAHCVAQYTDPTEKVKVSVSLGRLNLSDIESWSQPFEVAEIVPHPMYESTSFTNDLAIVMLANTATFNNYVRPICLWNKNEAQSTEVIGKEGTVTVWEITETANSKHLIQKAFMRTVPYETCNSNSRHFSVSESSYCADLRNGTSIGDSYGGGSMSYKRNGSYFIGGVLSLTEAINDKTTGIFTDVLKYLFWIDELAGECEKTVQCTKGLRYLGICNIDGLEPKLSEQKCKIVFSETANTNVTKLSVYGKMEALPDLSDATKKFKNLKSLKLLLGMKLQIIKRDKLAAFSRIEKLYLTNNLIGDIDASTFDDLTSLKFLDLSNSALKGLHPNLFRKLGLLKELFQIQII